MIKLSKRLDTIARLVPDSNLIADIGSDHAFLPIKLVNDQKVKHVIAGEVAVGPLEISKNNIEEAGLKSQITAILADGLEAINDPKIKYVDTTIIAGMGGKLIAKILSKDSKLLEKIDTLVLEPNTDEPLVRKTLNEYGFKIIDESILFEDGHYYEIIVAKRGQEDLSETALTFGPILVNNQNNTFKNKWKHIKQVNRKTVDYMLKAKNINYIKINQLNRFNKLIDEVLIDD